MKKYFTLLAFMLLGGFILTSCETTEYIDDGIDYDTYSVVYKVNNRTFTAGNNYSTDFVFPSNITVLSSDMVLVYRQKDVSGGNPVWEMIPKTIYLTNGEELDYDFDFTINDAVIFMGGTDLANAPTDFTHNQNFRVVIVPAEFGNKMDYTDYNKVIQYYNIDETKAIDL